MSTASDRNTIRAIDLFCGAGGSSWGAAQAGCQIVAGFDRWALAGEVYKDNFPDASFYNIDLEVVEPESFIDKLGRVDLILASPECTNHSPAKGGAVRCEKSRETAFHVVRFVAALNPRWVIVENVVNMRRWARYHEFIKSLAELGYRSREQVLDASDFGVPQTRRRLFILFDRKQGPPEVRAANDDTPAVSAILDTNGKYGLSPLQKPGRAPATIARAERAMMELGRNESFLLVYYGSDYTGWQALDRPLRTITTLDRFALVKPTHQGHAMRMLQPEELKLGMGWPQEFQINHGSRRDRIHMIGNAVCPPAMERVTISLCMEGGEKENTK